MTKKKTEEKSSFDLEQALKDYVCPDMFKRGLEYYIKSNNLKIKSQKEFDKVVDKFSNLTMGD